LGTKAGLIHRWDLLGKKELPVVGAHAGAVAGFHLLPDVKTLLSTGADGVIRRWDMATGKELSEPECPVGRVHAALSWDGSCAAVGDAAGRLETWDTRSGKRIAVLQRQGPRIMSLAFSPDGKTFAAAEDSGDIKLWSVSDPGQGKPLALEKKADLSWVSAMAFHPSGKFLGLTDRSY